MNSDVIQISKNLPSVSENYIPTKWLWFERSQMTLLLSQNYQLLFFSQVIVT